VIIADTNVWSELVRRSPDPAVVAWTLAHRDELALTSITVGELLYGLEIMPAGQRQRSLAAQVERLMERTPHRTFDYDDSAARHLAAIRSARRRAGREIIKPEDAMIAAIAKAHDCAVATRNLEDFAGMGVELIDPWRIES